MEFAPVIPVGFVTEVNHYITMCGAEDVFVHLEFVAFPVRVENNPSDGLGVIRELAVYFNALNPSI
jgi:hypothetical protein